MKKRARPRRSRKPAAGGRAAVKTMRNKAYIVVIAAALVVGVVGWMQWFDDDHAGHDEGEVAITIPALTAEAEAGQALFEENCIACHGRHASGTEQGPPLVHRIYEPNHHGDASFRLAVKNGVRAHHWPFGNMAPVEGVSDEDAIKITRYVRELQQANGIF